MVHASNKRGLFNSPVDAHAMGLADYHQVISKPMDLGTVKARLYSIAYHSRREVAEDIFLVFENAMTYNPPHNGVHIAASTLRDYFEDLYVAVGGTKNPLPAHIATTEIVGSPTPSVQSARRVSFAKTLSAAAQDKAFSVSKNCFASRGKIACLDSNEVDLVTTSTATEMAEPNVPMTEATTHLAPPIESATVCSVVNNSKPAPVGVTDLTTSIHASPQDTRARTNSFSSPAYDLVAAPTRRRRLGCSGKSRPIGHSCVECLGRQCSYCEQGCLSLEPTLLICNGSSCAGSKIRKGSTFFIAHDGSCHYCERCFAGLPPVLPGTENDVRYKRDLMKRKYDEELVESWLTCSKCDAGFHKICVLHNSHAHSSENYVCPGCMPPIESSVETVNASLDSTDIYSFVTGSELPLRLSDIAGKSFRLGEDVLSADALAETEVSVFIEAKVKQRLKQSCGVPNAEKTITVRIISDCERCFHVPEVVRKHFRMQTIEDREADSVVSPPVKVGYRSKAIALFQKMDGLDVCIFCMYVQEYEGNDEYDDEVATSSLRSKKRVYIAYLDSVEHFRPRHSRTDLYHELLVSYLASARVRGFETAHIWACPPSRGNSFVFWNHPASQRTPTKERLISWYHGALSRAIDCGVVTDVKSLYESEFQDHLMPHNAKEDQDGDYSLHSSGKMICPPLLEGDFWIEEAVRIHASSLARHVKAKSDGLAAIPKLPDGLTWEPCPARQIASLLADRLMSRPSSAPFRLPVNAAAMKLKDYHKVISKPMDLGTVYSRCLHGEYSTLEGLVADVELVFSNAKRFNPPGHYVHDKAIEVEGVFFKELNKVAAVWAGEEGKLECWRRFADTSMSLDAKITMPSSFATSPTVANEPGRTSQFTDICDNAPPSISSLAVTATLQTSETDDKSLSLFDGAEAVAGKMAGKDKWMLEKNTLPAKRQSFSKKGGGGKRRRRSAASSFSEGATEEEPSWKRRRQTWLGEEVAASVRSMRTSFFVCSLTPFTLPSSEKEKEKAAEYSKYTSCYQARPGSDSFTISSRITDARHALLELCQTRNLEFSNIRQAKYSTAMLLYHLHNHDAPGVVPKCTSCQQETVDLRWHKITRIEEMRSKDPASKKRPGRRVSNENKSKYQAEELCRACHEKHAAKEQFIPLPVTLASL